MCAEVAAAITQYGQGIVSETKYTGDNSDHKPFEDAGFTACEIWNYAYETPGDPNLHQATDSVDTAGYINYAFATKVTRAVVGYIAGQAVPVNGTSVLAATDIECSE